MMYRVRHIPSGLFYRRCREAVIKGGKYTRHIKTNLTKTPHIYHVKPSIGMLSGTFYNHLEAQELANQRIAEGNRNDVFNWHYRDRIHPFLSSEWMVETLADGEWKDLANLV